MSTLLKQVAQPQTQSSKPNNPLFCSCGNRKYRYSKVCAKCCGKNSRPAKDYRCRECGDAVAETKGLLCQSCRYQRPPIDPQIYVIKGVECRRIPLTQQKYATIVVADYDRVVQIKWHARWDPKGKRFYASSAEFRDDGKWHPIQMHRFILGLTDDAIQVDHIDGDGLNNTRANIRLSPPDKNQANCKVRTDNTSGYRGVSKRKSVDGGKWRAAICVKGKTFFLGHFDTPEGAARARDAAAIKYQGEFARLNFPEEHQPTP